MYGCRIADPGEFTKTAFLNGKMDISEAESVSDIIHAKSIDGVKLGAKNLSGGLSKKVKDVKTSVVSCLAAIEFNLDISEEELQPNLIKNSLDVLGDLVLKTKSAVKTFKSSTRLKLSIERSKI